MSDDTANTAEEWVFVARSVAGLPDGQPLALRCMARAGMAAQDEGDWVCVATAWAQDFDDPDLAGRCMAMAEAAIEQAYDWAWIAGIWKEELQVSGAASRCMGEAEEAAEDTDDWIHIAKSWMEIFQDTDAATRCMERAEDAAEGLEDHEAIEEAWRVGVPGLDGSIRNEAIQRLSDNPDVSDYLETFGMAVADHVNRQQAAILDLGVLTSSSTTQIGTWGAECVSERREGSSYARYYTFTLPQAAGVTIDLKSDVDAFLYLVSGDAHDGDVLDEDDDGGEDTDSRIRRSLAAGTCAIEATTFNEEEAGAFTLQVSLADPM